MKAQLSVFWFRRDLRLEDNIGLYNALKGEHPVLPIFIFDKTILNKLKNKNDLRVNFIHQSLHKLNKQLELLGSQLLVIHDTPFAAWKEIFSKFNIKNIYANEDYEPKAIKRDQSIKKMALEKNISFKLFKDQCIFHKSDVVKNNGTPYLVFTPYKNKWLAKLKPENYKSVLVKKYFKNFYPFKNFRIPNLKEIGFIHVNFNFGDGLISKNNIKCYDQTRDFPEMDTTSRIGHHLRFGTISIRKSVKTALQLNSVWLNELIWREFFMQIMNHFPHVINHAFKPKYENIQWRNNRSELLKWKQGKTGYPIVDAGMRELNKTGFMHNRVRMITASFLVKHLLIDWRIGEKYFAEKLLDYELSSNNGNWQWVAGTGCDAAPYFRIFNPDTQTKKFDTELLYIKKWVTELDTSHYPEPIVEHSYAYRRAIATYSRSLKL